MVMGYDRLMLGLVKNLGGSMDGAYFAASYISSKRIFGNGRRTEMEMDVEEFM